MAIYAIGDLQGCYDALIKLLDDINFDASEDEIWFAGDLVNRGPDSLRTLRFVKDFPGKRRVVLGNHDLHVLAMYHGIKKPKPSESLAPLLTAEDRDELFNWVRHQSLAHYDEQRNLLMVHAGVAPQWQAQYVPQHAAEVEAQLRSDQYVEFLKNMYGDGPAYWDEALTSWPRLRFITNALTRIRFCNKEGGLNLQDKGMRDSVSDDYLPWFELPQRQSRDTTIVFGHWSALGYFQRSGLIALDSGCVWGGCLTAVRLDEPSFPVFSVSCPQYAPLK